MQLKGIKWYMYGYEYVLTYWTNVFIINSTFYKGNEREATYGCLCRELPVGARQ